MYNSPNVQVRYGQGIKKQGYDYETYVRAGMSDMDLTPYAFETFDAFNQPSGLGTSVKTVDTTTASKISRPAQVYAPVRNAVDDTVDFQFDSIGDYNLSADQITGRMVRVGVPLQTTLEQWMHFQRAIKYGSERGVKVVFETTTKAEAPK